MKNTLIAIATIFALMALASCGRDYASDGTAVSFWTDKATGCNYVVQSQGGIYPRRGIQEPAACKD
jgi:hypothetical protein